MNVERDLMCYELLQVFYCVDCLIVVKVSKNHCYIHLKAMLITCTGKSCFQKNTGSISKILLLDLVFCTWV